MSDRAPAPAPVPLPARGTAPAAFEPARHLTRVNGADYLDVKWRLVWLRDHAPESQIITEMIEVSPEAAIFKATITKIVDAAIVGTATGYGSETLGDFRDYLEKAETKAIGRALAHLGYGTQFVGDSESDAGRVVDAPVSRPRQQPRPAAAQAGMAPPRAISPRDDGPRAPESSAPDHAATQRQLIYLQAVAREAGIDPAALDARSVQEFGVIASALSRRDASALIDLLQNGPAR